MRGLLIPTLHFATGYQVEQTDGTIIDWDGRNSRHCTSDMKVRGNGAAYSVFLCAKDKGIKHALKEEKKLEEGDRKKMALKKPSPSRMRTRAMVKEEEEEDGWV